MTANRFKAAGAIGFAAAILVGPALTFAVAALDIPQRIPALHQEAVKAKKAIGAAMLALADTGQRFVAVGERGIVLLSDDAGATWRQAKVPVSVSLTAVQFVDPNIGWAVGHLGVVLHTVDGGETWTKQLDGIEAAALALEAAKSGVNQAAVQRQIKFAERLVADGPDKPFLDLYFENAGTGYVVGAGNLMFRTDDGGKTWQAWMFRIDNPKSLNIYGIRAAGPALLLAGERGLLLSSSDGGKSFRPLKSPYEGSYFGLLAARTGEVVGFGLRGNAFWSGDQGNTWKKIETGVDVALSAGTELADGALVLASQAGEVLLSTDKGQTFRHMPAGKSFPIAAVVDSKKGGLLAAGLRGISVIQASEATAAIAKQIRD